MGHQIHIWWVTRVFSELCCHQHITQHRLALPPKANWRDQQIPKLYFCRELQDLSCHNSKSSSVLKDAVLFSPIKKSVRLSIVFITCYKIHLQQSICLAMLIELVSESLYLEIDLSSLLTSQFLQQWSLNKQEGDEQFSNPKRIHENVFVFFFHFSFGGRTSFS